MEKPIFYDMNASSPRRTICSVLRDIYHNSEDKQIKDWAEEATIMAKKMQKRLVAYKTEAASKEEEKKENL